MTRIHPDAPAIKIENTIDESPCPEPDFVWLKEMIMGDGVPEKQASSWCRCTGPCNQSSTTCTVIIRQSLCSDKCCMGFIYNANGKFEFGYAPIVECNEACRCTVSCPNKVSCQAQWTEVIQQDRGITDQCCNMHRSPRGALNTRYCCERQRQRDGYMFDRAHQIHDECHDQHVLFRASGFQRGHS